MARLKTLEPRIKMAGGSRLPLHTTAERRMTGRKLQARRLAIWQRDPRCANCGRVVGYPSGFELDHIIPLHQGGQDIESNCQVLCVETRIEGGKVIKTGCHVEKSAGDLRG